MKNINYFSLVLIAFFISSCKVNESNNASSDQSIYKKWLFQKLDGIDISNNKPIFIEFFKDNKFSGFSGCNNVFGNFEITNQNQIKFSSVASTKKMCNEESMKIEQQIFDVLSSTNNFSISNNTLFLNVGKRAPLASLTIMNDNPIINKYWKLISLNNKKVEMTETQEREIYFILKENGVITGFAGCNDFNGQYELKEQNRVLIKENLALTMKLCPDANTKEDEFINMFKQIDNYNLNADTLVVFSKEKKSLARFEAIYF